MATKYERYTDKYKRRRAELPYRVVNRKNLDRVGTFVLKCMDVAGDTPMPETWQSLVEQIDKAHAENPEYASVVLWRVLCNFSVK